MMEVSSLLSLPEGLRVEQRELQGSLLAMAVVSVRLSSCCPLCAQASSQVHSRDQRTLRDVACGGRKVVLHLSVRQFFCRNPDCARKVFSGGSLPLLSRGRRSPPGSLKRCSPLGLLPAENWGHDWPTASACTPHPPPVFAASWLLLHMHHPRFLCWE